MDNHNVIYNSGGDGGRFELSIDLKFGLKLSLGLSSDLRLFEGDIVDSCFAQVSWLRECWLTGTDDGPQHVHGVDLVPLPRPCSCDVYEHYRHVSPYIRLCIWVAGYDVLKGHDANSNLQRTLGMKDYKMDDE
jgi:hypothetical protein